MSRLLRSYWLGRRPYTPIHELMHALGELRRRDELDDTLLLLEHEPVITLGRGAKPANVLSTQAKLAELGIDLAETGRGGDVTLHAPGQLVAYPILNLSPDRQDVRKYVAGLTRIMAALIAPYDLDAGTVPGLIGLWLDRKSKGRFPGAESAQDLAKIGAIGVRISRWVTTHGFALNLSTDLSLFRLIVPCGINEHGVTSLHEMTGQHVSTEDAARRAAHLFAREYGRTLAPFRDTDNLNLADQPTPALLSFLTRGDGLARGDGPARKDRPGEPDKPAHSRAPEGRL